jgi:hypothetical protein
MLRFALALLATAAWADTLSSVNVSAFVTDDPVGFTTRIPGCGGDAHGLFSASITFTCQVDNQDYSGLADAATGIGPYGIGVSVDLRASGFNYPITSVASLSFAWSDDVIIRGAQGNGTAIIQFAGQDFGHPWTRFDTNLFGEEISFSGPGPILVPVTFGTAYKLTMTGSAGGCTGFSFEEDCVSPEVFVTGLSFENADGIPLPDAHLAQVPEISSFRLLCTCAVATLIAQLKRGKTHGRSRRAGNAGRS